MVENSEIIECTEALSPNSLKARPPFPMLPSFNPNALILSYLAYLEEIHELLNLLSQNAQKYGDVHNAILRNFIEEMPVDILWSQIARRSKQRIPLII